MGPSFFSQLRFASAVHVRVLRPSHLTLSCISIVLEGTQAWRLQLKKPIKGPRFRILSYMVIGRNGREMFFHT